MQIGPLRHRVELQQLGAETRDPTGGVTRPWATVVTRWAQIQPLRGSEKFEAAQMEPRSTVKIRIRYHATIDSTWRVKWTVESVTKYYNINAVINIGEKNFAMELECTEAEDN